MLKRRTFTDRNSDKNTYFQIMYLCYKTNDFLGMRNVLKLDTNIPEKFQLEYNYCLSLEQSY